MATQVIRALWAIIVLIMDYNFLFFCKEGFIAVTNSDNCIEYPLQKYSYRD